MATRLEDQLFELEEQFWTRGPDYYRGNASNEAIMVLPDPAGVMVKDEAMDSLAGQARWKDVVLEEHRVLQLDENAALVTYKATARRESEPPYVARASSAYVRGSGGWRLAFHQQTPLEAARP